MSHNSHSIPVDNNRYAGVPPKKIKVMSVAFYVNQQGYTIEQAEEYVASLQKLNKNQ